MSDQLSKAQWIQDLCVIIFKVTEKITDESDLIWTSFDSPAQLRNELDKLAEQVQQGNKEALDELNLHFLPGSTFQEHSLSNGWTDEYHRIASEFDSLFSKLKKSF